MVANCGNPGPLFIRNAMDTDPQLPADMSWPTTIVWVSRLAIMTTTNHSSLIDNSYIRFFPGPARTASQVDSAGNIYICGTGVDDGPNDQAVNAYVAKLNTAGTMVWGNSFGSWGYSDTATSIALDSTVMCT
jgi:hypothetical protein